MDFEFINLSNGKILQTNCYLIKNLRESNKSIIVDAPVKKHVDIALKKIKDSGLDFEDIEYIVITHSHFDHVQGLYDMKKKLTKAKILIHESESEDLENGDFKMPGGSCVFKIASMTANILKNYFNLFKYECVIPDTKVGDHFKISDDCYVIHTPGHSDGSISLIVKNVAFVGDTMYNRFGGIFGHYTWFYNDLEKIFEQWEKLVGTGCKTFFPAHGNKIDSSVIKNFLDSNKKKEIECEGEIKD